MSTYRLTDDDREALWQGMRRIIHEDAPSSVLRADDRDHALWAVTPAVEAIIAPIHERAEEAEDKAKTASDALDACPEILRLAEMSDAVSGWKARAEAAEKRADDLAAAVRSALAAWDSPGLTYGATARVFDDLRALLADPAAVLADRDRRMKAEGFREGWTEGASAVEFRGWEAHDRNFYNPYEDEGGRADD